MFVRFRATARRLQASLVATRRSEGRVRHEHVAGLGSVPLSPSAADRIAFWARLHQRLDALGNRVEGGQRGAILAAVHARIPVPTPGDQQAVQVERARADARFWATLAEIRTSVIEGNKELLALTERVIAERQALAADAAAKAKAAKDRLAKVESGEIVAGIAPPPPRKELLRALGWTDADAAQAERLARIDPDGPLWQELMAEMEKRKRQAEKAAMRAVLGRLPLAEAHDA